MTTEGIIQQVTGILGEHFKNYVVIVQDADVPSFFDSVSSDPFATTGLLQEALKYHNAKMDVIGALDEEIEWIEDDEETE